MADWEKQEKILGEEGRGRLYRASVAVLRAQIDRVGRKKGGDIQRAACARKKTVCHWKRRGEAAPFRKKSSKKRCDERKEGGASNYGEKKKWPKALLRALGIWGKREKRKKASNRKKRGTDYETKRGGY